MRNWGEISSDDSVLKTSNSLKAKGYDVYVVGAGTSALEKIKSLIPKGATVMNGASVTLEQIGYTEYLKSGITGWDNIHEQVLAEKDPIKQKKTEEVGHNIGLLSWKCACINRKR